jgi:hypothetical protein
MLGPQALPTLLAAVVLALVHLLAGGVKALHVVPRSRWLSLAGGVSVAYVFIHVLPELSAGQEALQEAGLLGFLEHHVYLMALLGLAVFYGLERAAVRSRQQQRAAGGEGAPSAGVYWLHIGSFTLYNALVGYLLVHREEPGLLSLGLFTVALGLHFVVNDVGLVEHYAARYEGGGRWLLAGSILAGWLVGVATELGEAALALLFAFLAGGVVLNVLKEELPEERESRFGAFALGLAGYAALLLAL